MLQDSRDDDVLQDENLMEDDDLNASRDSDTFGERLGDFGGDRRDRFGDENGQDESGGFMDKAKDKIRDLTDDRR